MASTTVNTAKPRQFQRHRWKFTQYWETPSIRQAAMRSSPQISEASADCCHYDRPQHISLIPHIDANHRHYYHHSNTPHQQPKSLPQQYHETNQHNYNHHYDEQHQKRFQPPPDSEFSNSSLPMPCSMQQVKPQTLPKLQTNNDAQQFRTDFQTYPSNVDKSPYHVQLHQLHSRHQHYHTNRPATNASKYTTINTACPPAWQSDGRCSSVQTGVGGSGQQATVLAAILWTVAGAVRSCYAPPTATGAIGDALRCVRAVLPLLLLLNMLPMIFAGMFHVLGVWLNTLGLVKSI